MTAAPYQAVILAAGRGSRIGGRTEEIPKALLPIGPRAPGDPEPTSFLRRQVELLRAAGVDEIVVVAGYLRDQVAAELRRWGRDVRLVVNPTPKIETSGSLHSLQFAARSPHGVLDGRRQCLFLDADIVYQREVLGALLRAPERSALLVSARHADTGEEVLAWGEPGRPRFLGKGLDRDLCGGAPCLGEAVGIVKLAPADHALARRIMDWMLGDPDAPAGSARHRGFGPARRATEHEELTQRLMQLGRMEAVVFSDYVFMECDDETEYGEVREVVYPRILALEARR